MKCSKCWLNGGACLDHVHHREVNLMLADGATKEDKPCRAMLALMKLSRALCKEDDCPTLKMARKCNWQTGRPECKMCWARWATR